MTKYLQVLFEPLAGVCVCVGGHVRICTIFWSCYTGSCMHRPYTSSLAFTSCRWAAGVQADVCPSAHLAGSPGLCYKGPSVFLKVLCPLSPHTCNIHILLYLLSHLLQTHMLFHSPGSHYSVHELQMGFALPWVPGFVQTRNFTSVFHLAIYFSRFIPDYSSKEAHCCDLLFIYYCKL